MSDLKNELDKIPENMSAWKLRLDLAHERALRKIDKDFNRPLKWAVPLIVAYLLFIAVVSGYKWASKSAEDTAIEQGHAHHDPMGGEFTWNAACGPRPEKKP